MEQTPYPALRLSSDRFDTKRQDFRLRNVPKKILWTELPATTLRIFDLHTHPKDPTHGKSAPKQEAPFWPSQSCAQTEEQEANLQQRINPRELVPQSHVALTPFGAILTLLPQGPEQNSLAELQVSWSCHETESDNRRSREEGWQHRAGRSSHNARLYATRESESQSTRSEVRT